MKYGKSDDSEAHRLVLGTFVTDCVGGDYVDVCKIRETLLELLDEIAERRDRIAHPHVWIFMKAL